MNQIKKFFTKTETVTYTDFYDREKTKEVTTLRLGRVIIAAILALALILTPILTVRFIPTGYTGILTSFGKVEETTLDAGLNVIAPWQKIVKLDNRTQKVEIQTDAFSSDIQQVQVIASINYSINQQTAHALYKTVGKHYYENIVLPCILENIKGVFAEYTAEDLISNRNILSEEIESTLRTDMEPYGITISNVSVEDIDFTEAFTDAVEAKQVAAQEKLTAQTKQEQLTMEKEAEAERALIEANTELEVTKIQAESAFYAGEKEAEVNKKIAESLTDELVEYYYVQRWDGKLPTTVLGENTSFLMNMN